MLKSVILWVAVECWHQCRLAAIGMDWEDVQIKCKKIIISVESIVFGVLETETNVPELNPFSHHYHWLQNSSLILGFLKDPCPFTTSSWHHPPVPYSEHSIDVLRIKCCATTFLHWPPAFPHFANHSASRKSHGALLSLITELDTQILMFFTSEPTISSLSQCLSSIFLVHYQHIRR